MSAPLNPFRLHVADQILAAPAGADPVPLPAPAIQGKTGYGPRYGQLACQVLTRLAAGEAGKSAGGGQKPCYWRRLPAAHPVPGIPVGAGRGERDAGEGR